MKKVAVASHNPVKSQATLSGFSRMFPEEEFQIVPVQAISGVSEQPSSDEETLRGATHRAHEAARQVPEMDFWVGIEGGIELSLSGKYEQTFAFAWVVILSKDIQGKARTGAFNLPPKISQLIHQGKELGEADDLVFGRTNSKQENGAVGLLTNNIIDRTQLYEQAVILALIPFKNPDLYRHSEG